LWACGGIRGSINRRGGKAVGVREHRMAEEKGRWLGWTIVGGEGVVQVRGRGGGSSDGRGDGHVLPRRDGSRLCRAKKEKKRGLLPYRERGRGIIRFWGHQTKREKGPAAGKPETFPRRSEKLRAKSGHRGGIDEMPEWKRAK